MMNIIVFWGLTILLGGGILGLYLYQSYALNQCQSSLDQCHKIDQATKLPNQQALMADFKRKSKGAKEQALMLLSINHFKMVNDVLGHFEVSKQMQHISTRINGVLSSDEILYYFGGDLFALYITKVMNNSDLEDLVRKILTNLDQPLVLKDSQFFISYSAGIVRYPSDSKKFNELMRYAELSMYVAKDEGYNSSQFYNKGLLEKFTRQFTIERELRNAIDHQEFSLLYQPKVSLGDYQITSYEALLRWENPVLGKVSPDIFIKIAEDTGLIIPIGRWVFYESCMAIKRINETVLIPKTVAINISVIQVLQEDFVTQMTGIVTALEVPPSWIEVELTESVFVESREIVMARLKELQAFGITVTIDDFGKEYSALSYLIKLPINNIKIDKVFIDTIGTQEEWIVPTLIDICHKMKCIVIAEGVETPAQLAYLKASHCDKIQGYIFSKPLIEDELLGLHFEV